MEDTAQLFLGLRIQCARCHHHPFEKWSQHDYYGFAAFFSRVGRKPGLQPGEDRVFHERGTAAAANIRRPASSPEADRPGRQAADALGRPAIRGKRWSTGWPMPRIRSSPGRWSIAIGSISSAADWSSRKTTCGSPIRRRIPNCSTPWPSISSQSKYDLKRAGADDLQFATCISSGPRPNSANGGDQQNFSHYYPRRLHSGGAAGLDR